MTKGKTDVRSTRKRRRQVPRYRAYQTGPLRGRPIVVISARGKWKRTIQRATVERIRLEREALRGRNSLGRMEMDFAEKMLAGVDEVETIARHLARTDRAKEKAANV